MTSGKVIANGRFVRVPGGAERDMGEERYAAERSRFSPCERMMELMRWRVDMNTGIFCYCIVIAQYLSDPL